MHASWGSPGGFLAIGPEAGGRQ